MKNVTLEFERDDEDGEQSLVAYDDKGLIVFSLTQFSNNGKIMHHCLDQASGYVELDDDSQFVLQFPSIPEAH